MVTVATPRVCQLAEPKKRLILEGGCEKSKSRAEPPRRESAHIELLACKSVRLCFHLSDESRSLSLQSSNSSIPTTKRSAR